MSRCVIISACPVSASLASALRPGDTIIACDAGYRNCGPLGCRPDIIVGDFDTAPCPAQEGGDTIILPHVKDDTDGINFDASIAGGDEITLFRNGTLQMAFCWNIAQQLNADNNDAGLTNDGDEIMPMAFPTASGDPKLCGGIWGFGVFDNGDEAKVKAAKTFIEFIAADPDQVKDSVLASTYFPVRASVGDIYSDNAIMSEYTKFMAYLGDYYQITPGWATARTEWWNMLQRVGTGEDVATSVATFVQNANAAAKA